MVADTGIFIKHLRAKDKLSTTLYKMAEGTDIYVTAERFTSFIWERLVKKKMLKIIIENITVLPFINPSSSTNDL